MTDIASGNAADTSSPVNPSHDELPSAAEVTALVRRWLTEGGQDYRAG